MSGDRDGQGREALAAAINQSQMVPCQDGHGQWLFRSASPEEMADDLLASDWMKAHDAEVAAATAEQIAGVVKEQREKYLDSSTLDPAWVAGWHAATAHIAHHVARADESNPR